MNFLSYNTIMAEAANCGNGRYIRMGYCKEMPVTAEWLAEGVRVYKLTETTVRLGVNYSNLPEVKARRAQQGSDSKRRITNNWKWILPNKVKENSNTGKTYLQVYTVKGGHNTVSKYLAYSSKSGEWLLMSKPEYELSEYALMVDPKASSSSNTTDVYTVTIDKIYKLGKAVA